jgi:hypothetical protein
MSPWLSLLDEDYSVGFLDRLEAVRFECCFNCVGMKRMGPGVGGQGVQRT